MTRIDQTASQLDTAIDRLLRERSGLASSDEGELTATARLLRDALPRFHPRFGFEEHLAARLAAAPRLSGASTTTSEPLPIGPHLVPARPVPGTVGARQPTSLEHRRRGLVAGGAIASGVSLAGAALVVWRRSRSGGVF